jgi:hypothetical protein
LVGVRGIRNPAENFHSFPPELVNGSDESLRIAATDGDAAPLLCKFPCACLSDARTATGNNDHALV